VMHAWVKNRNNKFTNFRVSMQSDSARLHRERIHCVTQTAIGDTDRVSDDRRIVHAVVVVLRIGMNGFGRSVCEEPVTDQNTCHEANEQAQNHKPGFVHSSVLLSIGIY
jgi:hypothetical protein